MKRTYLDYAATTPVDPAVFNAMKPYFAAKFGNPGSLHLVGQEAIAALDKSRETIARSIGAGFREVVFTSSATEANNLALRGVWQKGAKYEAGSAPRIIISAIEHESIRETAESLKREGAEVVYIPVDRNGVIDLEKLEASLNKQTVLVSVMYANNEIGSVQPIAEIGKMIRRFREARDARGKNKFPLFHTDAAQAFQFLDCNVETLGVDLMTISSHKIYGPKGAGLIYVRNNSTNASSDLTPQLSGGGQEHGLRSGTENVPAIVGFAKSVELADAARKKEVRRIAALRSDLWRGIKKAHPKAEMNGVVGLPNILNVYFPGHAAQDMLTMLDLNGLAVSSGSACRSRAMESSYVIEALGYSKDRARSSIRFSLGRPTTKAEIATVVKLFSQKIRTV